MNKNRVRNIERPQESTMPNISVRVSNETKQRMDEKTWINWSEVLRQAIHEKLSDESKRDLARAVLINEKLRRKAHPGWSSAEFIKNARLERHVP